jgi:hypothetical protein
MPCSGARMEPEPQYHLAQGQDVQGPFPRSRTLAWIERKEASTPSEARGRSCSTSSPRRRNWPRSRSAPRRARGREAVGGGDALSPGAVDDRGLARLGALLPEE